MLKFAHQARNGFAKSCQFIDGVEIRENAADILWAQKITKILVDRPVTTDQSNRMQIDVAIKTRFDKIEDGELSAAFVK